MSCVLILLQVKVGTERLAARKKICGSSTNFVPGCVGVADPHLAIDWYPLSAVAITEIPPGGFRNVHHAPGIWLDPRDLGHASVYLTAVPTLIIIIFIHHPPFRPFYGSRCVSWSICPFHRPPIVIRFRRASCRVLSISARRGRPVEFVFMIEVVREVRQCLLALQTVY